MIKRSSLFLFVILIALFSTSVADAQKKGKKPAAPAEVIGQAAFPISCKKTVQKSFDRGINLLHSFWYQEAEQAFTSVIQTDPNCAMGYWGIAMSLYHPLWEAPSAADLKRGWTFAARAKKLGSKSERERDYLAALETFYHDSDKVDHATRALAYEKAMEQLHQKHPDDREGAIFYALSLLGTASPADKTYANQKKAAEILNPILAEAPEHPGVIHYLIHATDSPALASEGLNAARAYAKIAPSVPHALHMPSHIFIRLGLWQEAIDSNRASDAAAKSKMKGNPDPRLHAMDYLIYAYLQKGEDLQAKGIVNDLAFLPKAKQESLTAAYAQAAIPARHAIERRRWAEAVALTAHPSRYPYTEAITYFSRAVGAARSHRLIEARGELEVLKSVRDRLVEAKNKYWADQVEVLLQAAAAWTEYADGKHERAVLHMRTAADLEDSLEKHPVTPGPIVPAREMLADLLLEVGEPEAALIEFEKSLKNAPNRFNGLYGAARAAERAENFEAARSYYEKLVAGAGESGDRRTELAEAKAFLDKAAEQTGSEAPAAEPAEADAAS
jgi:tetratricopeptide (TPR) repeat protein